MSHDRFFSFTTPEEFFAKAGPTAPTPLPARVDKVTGSPYDPPKEEHGEPDEVTHEEWTDLLATVEACKHRGAPSCDCKGVASCALGKGVQGQVTLSDCVTCVQTTDDAEPR